ncbi:6-phosphogluconolactonase, cycloisomerase 2 family [Paraburkholderia steynii]|uniref:6-phosphogluconolactonase, cycloisomerase 2 family n=1 Tax=Paraburkholderia steynii TaxID=1245441 RepID=A0A7Z7FLP7_9BURK|nr:beta-propeller fold lactonase family protein [Paraburkholderia steynii]SDJ15541.1 6-phosphogluconolactonase, cycloisomerase 2 family [Paraburkholderia steynii]
MASVFAYVGCRTTRERNARGKGIGVYAVDTSSGAWESVEVFEPLENPSFLALNEAQDVLYAVHGDGAEVSSFAVDPANGRLSLLNRQACGGRNPVHLALSRSGDALVVANYATGCAARLPVGENGTLGTVAAVVELPGAPGPHRIEQGSSHPHHIARYATRRYNTDWHIVPDKGLDTVFAVKWDGVCGKAVVTSGRSREGSGPRHAAFHPTLPIIYVANELDSTLTAWGFEPLSGALEPLHTISMLPCSRHETSRAAGIAIRPDASALYVSNRGHDSIATVGLDGTTGIPVGAQWTEAHGQCPRFLCLSHDARMLYVANELSDSIVQYLIEAEHGTPTPTGRIVQTGSPVCIVFKSH